MTFQTQTEQDALVCYLMAIKEEKPCMAWWVGIAEKVARREWPQAHARLMEIHNRALLPVIEAPCDLCRLGLHVHDSQGKR